MIDDSCRGGAGIPDELLTLVRTHRPDVRCFIETGTYMGETVEKVAPLFDVVLSVELSSSLAEKAQERFRASQNVTVYHGIAFVSLSHMLERVGARPALLWFDAHYSGCGETAREAEGVHCSVAKEVAVALDHARATGASHIFVLDDAIDYIGHVGFPRLHEIARQIVDALPDYKIRLYPQWRRGVLVAARDWRD